jgi:aminoglycoside/choline kinase family phosphotransferase
MTIESTDRSAQLQRFIDSHFSGVKYSMTPIVGDAGLRDYFRLSTQDSNYIIMDCPPSYTSVKPFIDVAQFLTQNDFSAPQIINYDTENGFLILQDFGKVSVRDYILGLEEQDLQERTNIYHLSINLLVDLQKIAPPSELQNFSNDLMCSELSVFSDYYIPYKKNEKISSAKLEQFIEIWQNILSKQTQTTKSIILRDYHVENMMYLDQEKNIKKLGLLDFQDALVGSPIYDLVSILEDARIDIPRNFALECIQYYAEQKNLDFNKVLNDYHILGAQRNLRILGVFARKYSRDGNDTYLQYIPRVLKYLEYDLSHPILRPLKDWLLKTQII